MIKLRQVSKLAGMQLHVSKVKKVPVNVHEEFDIEGTDRGVLKRIATEKSLQEEVRRRAQAQRGVLRVARPRSCLASHTCVPR